MESLGAVHRGHGEVGLWIREQEQADPAHPQHPPGDLVCTELVRHHATHRAQHATGQGEAGRQQRRHADVQTELAHVVLHHPQRERHVTAEDDAVVLAVLEHLGVLERLELVHERHVARHEVVGVAVGEEPEQHHRAQHDGRVHLRHHGPAKRHQQHRRHKLVDRSTRVARAVHAHGHALAVFREPARHVGRTDRERAAGQTHEQADGEEVPVGGGVAHEPDRRHGDGHEDGHHDAAAVAVGPDAQRHAHQRTGEHRRGHEQAELGGVEVERFLDRDADDAEHHPHHETHGEGQRADDQHGPRFFVVVQFRGHDVFLHAGHGKTVGAGRAGGYPPPGWRGRL